jgi:outer membrane protein assembly factor BamB
MIRPLLFATILGSFALAADAADWPAFRGPNGNGVAPEDAAPPLKWDRETNIAWRVPLDAPGNSSPIVVGDVVYITASDKPGKTLSVLAFDRLTGQELWKQSVTDDQPGPTHNTNPYAAGSPVCDGERLVVWYGQAGLHAYSLDGNPIWSVETPHVKHIWGYGTSPVIHAGRVYLNNGIGPEAAVAAYDVTNGQPIWKTPEPGGDDGSSQKGGGWIGSWSTPNIVTVDGVEQLIVPQSTRVVAYDLADGKILWYCEGLANLPRGNLAYTSLMFGDGYAVALGGFNGPAIGFKLGGQGNVTEQNRLWRAERNNPQRIGSAVVLGDNVFLANSGPGIIECLDLKTGEPRWRARPESGGNFWGSVIHAAGRLYVTNQNGLTLVFAPNPTQFELLAENPLGEHCNATPAVAGKDVFIRTYEGLYGIRE